MRIGNIFSINLAKNPIAHGRNKHIEIRFHYLIEEITNGKVYLEH